MQNLAGPNELLVKNPHSILAALENATKRRLRSNASKNIRQMKPGRKLKQSPKKKQSEDS